MNISDNGYILNNSVNNTQARETGAASASRGADVAGSREASGNAQILQVSEGQLFHGQILNVTNSGEVSIRLDNSATLMAHMADAVNLNIGDSLNFLVKQNDGSNVVIKPFGQQASSVKDGAIFKALDLNNLAPTEKNYMIAEKLMDNNMPVDRAGMQRIMQQSYKYPDASIDTLVSLNRQGLPVNETSIVQYDAYMSNTHQLAQDIPNMAGKITEFTTTMLNEMAASDSTSDINAMLSFQDNLLSVFSDIEDMTNISEALQSKALAEIQTEEEQLAGVSENENQTVSSEELSRTDVLSEAKDVNAISEEGKITQSFFENNESVQKLLSDLTFLGVSQDNIQKLMYKSETPIQFLNNINALLAETSNSSGFSKEELKELLSSDSYKKIFQDAIKKKFTLDGNKLQNPKELDDLYKSIYDKTSKLMNAFSQGGGAAGQDMRDGAKGMQERLDFIQNLNEMYTYAQIPVNFSGNEMNSELFVYMNKKKMKESKEEVSALLHLDMEHLGATDVHVSLHGTTVHTRFYVEDEQSAKIIDEHMNMLEKAINDSGYTLTNEVVTRDVSLGTSNNKVVEEMLGKDLEKSVKRYSFDVRT